MVIADDGGKNNGKETDHDKADYYGVDSHGVNTAPATQRLGLIPLLKKADTNTPGSRKRMAHFAKGTLCGGQQDLLDIPWFSQSRV